jgi:hypothetical protein
MKIRKKTKPSQKTVKTEIFNRVVEKPKVVEKIVEVKNPIAYNEALATVKKNLTDDPVKYNELKELSKLAYYQAVRTSNIPLSQEKLNVLAATIAEKYLQLFIK